MNASIPPTLAEAQRHAALMAQRVQPPERYRWNAIWWHLESKRRYPSAAKSLEYASNLLVLRRDMLARPDYYARKPQYYRGNSISDWQWMKLENRA